MKQKSGWKRITLLRKTSFKKRLKILAGYKRQLGSYDQREIQEQNFFELSLASAAERGGNYGGRKLGCYR